MRVARALAFLWAMQAAVVLAEPGPPPDPQNGDGYDGRPRRRWTTGDGLLLVPRVVLLPVRLVWKGISYPVVWYANADEKYHLTDRFWALLTSDDGQIGIRPEFSFISGYKPNFGASFFDRKLFGPQTAFNLTMTGANQNIIYVSARARPTPLYRRVSNDIAIIYNRRNDLFFDGIGSVPGPNARYAVNAVDLRNDVRLRLSPRVQLGFGAMFGFRRFANGTQVGSDPPIDQVYCVRDGAGACIPGTVNPELVPGFHRGTQFLRFGVGLRIDGRDSTFRPSSGVVLDLGADYSHGLAFDDSSYFQLRGAATLVLNLWQRSRILLLRLAARDIETLNDTPVPFSELVVLGGPDDFRGFRLGAFRDSSSVLMGAEFRWPVWMWMDAAIFTEYGGVFSSHWSNFTFDNMHPDIGFGLRVRTERSFIMRFDVAYGWNDGGGLQFYFSGSVGP
jgi:outer membrane protein assembly factor BamA